MCPMHMHCNTVCVCVCCLDSFGSASFTQHSVFVYLLLLLLQRFLGQPEIPVETAVRVYRRYLQLEPTHAEEFIAYLKSKVHLTSGVVGSA